MSSKLEQNIMSIEKATSEEALQYSVEQMIDYILKYPEVTNKAAKVCVVLLTKFNLKTSLFCSLFITTFY